VQAEGPGCSNAFGLWAAAAYKTLAPTWAHLMAIRAHAPELEAMYRALAGVTAG
jgi:hypothetical protein